MIRTASRRRHEPGEELWFPILIAVIMAMSFVAVFLYVPR